MNGDVQLPFGEAPDGRMVAVRDVPNGLSCECVCPKCRRRLISKQGEIKQWHFAHEGDAECVGALESVRHRMAKQIVCDERVIHIPIRSEIMGFLTSGDRIELTDCTAERWMDGLRADILARWQDAPLIIEFAVTHYCETEKIRLIRERRINCIEIDLAPYFFEPGEQSLRDAVMHGATRRWLYHPEIEQLREEAAERERRQREEIAERQRRAAAQWREEQEAIAAEEQRREERRRLAATRTHADLEYQTLIRQELDRRQAERTATDEAPAEPRQAARAPMQISVGSLLRVALIRPSRWVSDEPAVTPGAFCGRCEGRRWIKSTDGWACSACAWLADAGPHAIAS